MNSHYVVLGVSETATPEVIQIAYEGKLKALERAELPKPERAAEERALHAAYKTLSDPRRRERYDAQLADALERVERRSRKAGLAIGALVVAAAIGAVAWYLDDRAQRLEAVRQEEARLARELQEKQRRAATEEKERARRGLEAAVEEHEAQKREEAERVRAARESRAREVEAIRARAEAERRAAEERNRRR